MPELRPLRSEGDDTPEEQIHSLKTQLTNARREVLYQQNVIKILLAKLGGETTVTDAQLVDPPALLTTHYDVATRSYRMRTSVDWSSQ